MRNSLLGGIAIVGALTLMIPAAPALAQSNCGIGQRCSGGNVVGRAPGQFRYQHHGYARDDRRGNGVGLGVAAGAALATGAIIGGAMQQNQDYYPDNSYVYSDPGPSYVYSDPSPVYDDVAPQVADQGDTVAYCQRTYRSYDLASGTYLGYDGLRHPCP